MTDPAAPQERVVPGIHTKTLPGAGHGGANADPARMNRRSRVLRRRGRTMALLPE